MGGVIDHDKREITIQFEIDETTLAWLALEAHNLDQKLNEYIVDVLIKFAKETSELDSTFDDPDYRIKR